jgi:hypothetical protein
MRAQTNLGGGQGCPLRVTILMRITGLKQDFSKGVMGFVRIYLNYTRGPLS